VGEPGLFRRAHSRPTDRPLDPAGKLKLRFSLAGTKPGGSISNWTGSQVPSRCSNTPACDVGEPSGVRRFIIGPVSAPFRRDSPVEETDSNRRSLPENESGSQPECRGRRKGMLSEQQRLGLGPSGIASAPERDRGFESSFLQRGVSCEPDFQGRIPSMTVGDFVRITCKRQAKASPSNGVENGRLKEPPCATP
jgi:hypothetical protein